MTAGKTNSADCLLQDKPPAFLGGSDRVGQRPRYPLTFLTWSFFLAEIFARDTAIAQPSQSATADEEQAASRHLYSDPTADDNDSTTSGSRLISTDADLQGDDQDVGLKVIAAQSNQTIPAPFQQPDNAIPTVRDGHRRLLLHQAQGRPAANAASRS